MRRMLHVWSDLRELRSMPHATIDLMLREARENHEFYHRITLKYYVDSMKRHRRFPLVRQNTLGVALCPTDKNEEEYFMFIEASARRNCKKARRLGYRFDELEYNRHLDDVTEIWRSTPIRQGKSMPEDLLEETAQPVANPKSLTDVHAYSHFGVLLGDKLYAYVDCFVCGEIAMITNIYGHFSKQPDGVVPLLIVETYNHLLKAFPQVRFYGYGTYFGASESLRRFKRKFRFLPHRVRWVLGDGQVS